jgi:hypothetical protein
VDGHGSASDAAIRANPAAGMNGVSLEERAAAALEAGRDWAYEKT